MWLPIFVSLAAQVPDSALVGDGVGNYRPLVAYDLEARLDPSTRSVKGKGTVRWTNGGHRPVNELWWHLYLNAFRNDRSTFMKESGGKLRGDKFERGEWGDIQIDELRLGEMSLMETASYEHPDDDNDEDRTVLRTPLPAFVEPGQTIALEIEFTSRLPKVFARSGWGGSFFMVAQWFPKLGVLEDSYRKAASLTSTPAWNCHQYHATSEFFADYGRFRVAITVPKDHVVAATGERIETTENADGTVTVVYEQDRVHDFAFSVDPRFLVRTRTFDPSTDVTEAHISEASALLGLSSEALELGVVEVSLYLQPEHAQYEERYFRATFEAIRWFGLWYGAYPYDVLAVVDGPRVARGAMGMEYPTLITGGVQWPAPSSMPSPESVTVHEFGHQYWYGLVGTNEFEESWLDEGFNTYSTGKVLDRAYGGFVFAPRVLGLPLVPYFSGLKIEQLETHRMATAISPTSDAIARPAWLFRSPTSYGINSYPRTALALRQLEREIGPTAVARALRAYHLRHRYRHPSMEDFIAAVEESAGRSMDDFFEAAFYTSGKIDYAVTELESKRVKPGAGYFDGGAEVTVDEAEELEDGERDFETVVVVERRGEAHHPVTLEVAFEDGTTEILEWDGRYRWQRYRFVRPSKAKHARLHPDGQLPMDLDRGNDSRTVDRSALPGATWGAHVLYVAQTIWQMLGGVL